MINQGKWYRSIHFLMYVPLLAPFALHKRFPSIIDYTFVTVNLFKVFLYCYTQYLIIMEQLENSEAVDGFSLLFASGNINLIFILGCFWISTDFLTTTLIGAPFMAAAYAFLLSQV